MILILENGKLNLIANHTSRTLLGASVDLNTVYLQEKGRYYFGNGEINVMPNVPSVTSMERGDSITQHLTIDPAEVNTYFNELFMPQEFDKDNLPFEFLREIKDGYKLSNHHTRIWIFDKKFLKHFNLVNATGFNVKTSLLEHYLEAYRSFSSLAEMGMFSIEIEKLYENLDKFNGDNYADLHKWEAKITPQEIKVQKISWRDLDPIQILDASVDPRSADLKTKVTQPLTVAATVVTPAPAEEKPKRGKTEKVEKPEEPKVAAAPAFAAVQSKKKPKVVAAA